MSGYHAPQGKRIPSTPLDDYHNLIQQAKSGVGRIVLLSNGKVPVIPIYIHGTYEALSFGNFIPKYKSYLSVSVCKPLIFTKYTRKEGWDQSKPDFHTTAKTISQVIMRSIRDQMVIEEKYFFEIISHKVKKPFERLDISYKSHPRVYDFFRNLLRYSPAELREWLENQ